MRPTRRGKVGWAARVALCGFALAAARTDPSGATPYDYIPVGDPLEEEIRILDLLDSDGLRGRIRLPHTGTRPLQVVELQGIGRPPEGPDVARRISLARLERALGRDRGPLFSPHPEFDSTPRLLEYGSELQRLQLSAGIVGRGELDRRRSVFTSGTGIHGHLAMGLDRLVAFTHYVIGRIADARRFGDPIVPDTDFFVLPEETFLSYTEELGQWGAQFGRSRWHWGPGEEGSLVLSRTSPVLTGLSFRTRLTSLRADAIALSATLRQSAGEQLAAHRIEWQPTDALRLGVSEAARYQSPGWKPLYLIGAIPYVLVERLERQSEPDSAGALRNNVLTAFDVAWRVAEGTRIYAEILADDVGARSGKVPNKLGFQLGWEGVGAVGATRLAWGGEFTRINRYVYTSFFGRDHAHQGVPLGFPTGPDARRVRLRTVWDLDPDWQVGVRVTQTDKGENDLDEPFFPGSGRVSASTFEGVVETTRELELSVRWWPASGVNVRLVAAHAWIDNREHRVGSTGRSPSGALEVRLMR